MIDIHAHILPDLDDGSEDMEESLEMAELAVESGVEIMAATPHSNQMGRFENFQSEQLQTAFERLRMVLKKEKIPLKILNGMEIFASEDIAQKIKNKQLSESMGRIIIWSSFRLMQIPGGSGNVWRISLIRGRYH